MLHRPAELPMLGKGLVVLAPDLSAVAAAAAQLAASIQEVARQLRLGPVAQATAMHQLEERRRDQRIEGGEMQARVATGEAETVASIVNMGRGGVWLRGALEDLPEGTAVRIGLPDAADAVAARLVRHTEDGAAFAFHQDAGSLLLIDQALEAIAGRGAAFRDADRGRLCNPGGPEPRATPAVPGLDTGME
jgi:hypothetical protein